MAGRSPILAYGLPIIAVIALLGGMTSIASKIHNRTRVEPRIEPVPSLAERVNDRAAPAARIGAVGLVEPSSQEIKVGTGVSGTVAQVFVAPGARTRRGDPLFALDARMTEAALSQRRGDLATAQARLALARYRVPGLEAEVEAARTAVEAAQAEQDEARDLFRTASGLNAGSTITAREITRRKNLMRRAEARCSEARARLAVALANLALFDEAGGGGASIAVELAAVEQARHAVKLAETDLELRRVLAPDDGTVLQVNLRPGEFAQAGALSQPLMVLGRTEPMHVRIDIDEADIPRYRPGAPAMASERGRAHRRMKLSFVRIEPLVVPKRALSGQATERVDTRVMQVIYAIEPDGSTVLPGQQVDVFIESEQVETQATSVASSVTAKKD
jgi:multidrug resistance efflux pump